MHSELALYQASLKQALSEFGHQKLGLYNRAELDTLGTYLRWKILSHLCQLSPSEWRKLESGQPPPQSPRFLKPNLLESYLHRLEDQVSLEAQKEISKRRGGTNPIRFEGDSSNWG